MSDLSKDLRACIRDVPDFPSRGILFKDITPLLADPALFDRTVKALYAGWDDVDVIVGMESRGFLFGTPMARDLGVPFAPARKKGKLPHSTVEVSYDLEYGSACLQMHTDAIQPGQRVLIVDDLVATGGTAIATIEMVRKLGGVIVGCVFVVDLSFLPGRARVEAQDVLVRSLLTV
jgi:adenine phosphoribosyltransferase